MPSFRSEGPGFLPANGLRADEFDYDLPQMAIAQVPAEPRESARLLVATDATRAPRHQRVADLPDLVAPGDVLVVNETRVLPARLHLRKATGGAAEVLLLEETAPGSWLALVRPGRRLPEGSVLWAGEHEAVRVGADAGDGRRLVELLAEDPASLGGEIPFPPYIEQPDRIDPARYQTVYAVRPGSVAAPTAGLHLTSGVLDRCRDRGATVANVELAIGLDTFRSLSGEYVSDHVMHSERYRVPESTIEACAGATRVIAVGTTTVRALEAAASTGRLTGRTDLFIQPGFSFRAVDVLMTNFHLPRSTLLVLLAAFCGDQWRDLYRLALSAGYRFLSFGDAMLVARTASGA